MNEVVTDQYPVPMLSAIEDEIEVCYSPETGAIHRIVPDTGNVALSKNHPIICTDQLRHYVSMSEDGYCLDIRYSHDEFEFIYAVSKWMARITHTDLEAYPDLSELVITEFREGARMEDLPVIKLKAYAERWDLPFWCVIQVYKKLSRDLHGHYQSAVKQWALEFCPDYFL